MAKKSKTGVIKRGKSFRIWYIDSNGGRVYETVDATNFDEASKIRAMRILEIDQGKFVKKSKITLNEFFEIFKNEYLIDAYVKLGTRKSYMDYYRISIRNSQLDSKYIQSIKSSDIQKFYADVLKAKGYSNQTMKNLHVYLKGIFSYAVRRGDLSESPMKNVKPIKVRADKGTNQFVVWTPEQLSDFLSIARSKDILSYYPMALTVMTGLRVQEVFGLQWKDIDFENKVINLSRTCREINGEKYPFVAHGKTEKSMRPIKISTETVNLLSSIRGTQVAIKSEIGNMYENLDGWICSNRWGKLYRPSYVAKAFRKIVLANPELPRPMHLRGFRHLFATYLLLKKVHPKVVQEHLRHSSYDQTFNTYSHVIDNVGREAVELIDELNILGSK